MSNGFFPKWFSDGRIASAIHDGAGTICIWERGASEPRHAGVGIQPHPKGTQTVVVKGANKRLVEVNVLTGAIVADLGPEPDYHAAGGGKFITSNEKGAAYVAVSRHGRRAWIVEHGSNGNDNSVIVEGVSGGADIIVARGSCHDVRIEHDLLVWAQQEQAGNDSTRRIFGVDLALGGAPRKISVFPGWSTKPVPIATPSGPWVLYITNDDLRLHPWGVASGFIERTGADQNFNPDAICLMANAIWACWNRSNGELRRRDILFSEPREDCSKASGGVVVVTPPAPKVPCEKRYPGASATDLTPCTALRPDGTVCGQAINRHHRPKVEVPVSFEPALIPDDAQETIRAFAAKFPPPTGPAENEEHFERCRGWMEDLAEQLRFSHPHYDFGRKRASASRPWSKDGLPRRVGAVVHNWDLLAGAGTGQPVLNSLVGYRSIDISDQVFEGVSPVNHLASTGGGQTNTHRYQGGGNDTGTCDQCGAARAAAVHQVPEGLVKGHTPWQGEDGIGPCDLCGREVGDDFHKAASGGGSGSGGTDLTPRVDALDHQVFTVHAKELKDREHETAELDQRAAELARRGEQQQRKIDELRNNLGELNTAHGNTVAIAHKASDTAEAAKALADLTQQRTAEKFKEVDAEIAALKASGSGSGSGGGLSVDEVKALIASALKKRQLRLYAEEIEEVETSRG